MEQRYTFNSWVTQNFGEHLKVSNDGTTKTRVRFDGKGFSFTGINPLKLPKRIQAYINEWMRLTCLNHNIAVWDVEAWTDYGNTRVVH